MVVANFVEMIATSIRDNWELEALSNYKEEDFTFGKTGEEILRFHKLFQNLEVQRGEKISVIGKNNINWALTYLSTTSYGAVIVPLLQDFHSNDIVHIVNHSDSTILFISDSIFEKLDLEQLKHLKAIYSLDTMELLYTSVDNAPVYEQITLDEKVTKENFKLPEIGHEELLGILYTSGTSGFSKGVMLKHKSLAANVEFGVKYIQLTPGMKIVSFLPLAHAYGVAFEFLSPFAMGCHINFLGKVPSPQIILKAFADVRPNLIFAVPLIIEKIYKKKIKPAISKPAVKLLLHIPLLNRIVYNKVNRQISQAFGGNFKEVIIGGAAFNSDVEKFLRKAKFKYTVGYGMTECGPLISYAAWDDLPLYSCGKPIPYVEVRIDSPNPRKTPGEILVRGFNVMTGYYKNDEATQSAIDREGWLHTGDLGVMDKDDYIYIKGRSKNMILGASGQNIYPEEIEAKLNNMPYVQESIVVEDKGRLHALIVPDQELIEAENLSREKLEVEMQNNQKHLNHQLPAYMSISKIILHDKEFEKTPKKSIKRYLYTVSQN
ncbi:MAG: long-chain fatty acid--CoA ligase [Salinivirgaceae bacterium]|nr:MAG: long-chain fatty acid--CoA ligase [Salinivirgaceae bacterium]